MSSSHATIVALLERARLNTWYSSANIATVITSFADACTEDIFNGLEKLKGALGGKYSIRVNDQFRIVFNFDRGEATHVTITDYHR